MLELEAVSAGAVFALGLRHGIDPDHLAAIGDLVGSQTKARRSMLLATGYALGHAATIITLSALAAWLGHLIPPAAVSILNEIVGVSLVLMGAFLLYSLVRWGSQAQLRSRWSMLIQFVRMMLRRRSSPLLEIEHEHPHSVDPSHGHLHATDGDGARTSTRSAVGALVRTHTHRHRHVLEVPADPLPRTGVAASAGVGVLHGIGAETPSQIALLTTAAGFAGSGMLLAVTFVAGLLLSNSMVAVAGVLGLNRIRRGSAMYTAVIILAAGFSIFVGASYLLYG